MPCQVRLCRAMSSYGITCHVMPAVLVRATMAERIKCCRTVARYALWKLNLAKPAKSEIVQDLPQSCPTASPGAGAELRQNSTNSSGLGRCSAKFVHALTKSTSICRCWPLWGHCSLGLGTFGAKLVSLATSEPVRLAGGKVPGRVASISL